MSAANPRIGIIGTGAIGGFYGLMLSLYLDFVNMFTFLLQFMGQRR